jgi:3-dehydroquinate dehydratase/shikimate dehydrogenase
MATFSQLCQVITAPTMAELRARRDAVGPEDADLVELRLDTLTDDQRPDVAGALDGRRLPVIVTCRASWEGGQFKGSEEERQRILREALEAGAEHVDIEHRAVGVERWLRQEDRERRVICSLHDFDGMPRDLADRVEAMRRTGAAVVKVAGRAERLRDLLPMLAIGRSQPGHGRTVLIGMGPSGMASRVLAAHFGSCWTYAGDGVAPGQVTATRLLKEFRFRSIRADTPVYAVVGRPISHSISPAMHNAAFEAAGLDAVYIPLEATDFDDFLALASELPIAGASVTAPYKLAAFEGARPIDRDVERLRAANTLRRTPDAWECTNTDVPGFLAPLTTRLSSLHGTRVAVLGAGGAARAVVAGLDSAGATVTVYARNEAAARDVASIAPNTARGAKWPAPAGSWDVLVNTTPVGTSPNVNVTPFEGPFDGKLVYDLIYNPRQTRLLREAAAAGCATLDGLDMLVEQAARQFAWWTGITPSSSIMRDAALARLGS